MKLGKRILSALLVVCMMLVCVPLNAHAAGTVASGKYGSNLTWVLDDSGTLTISGTGPMADLDNIKEQPWYANSDNIKQINIEYGITTIGNRAFADCTYLTDVIIPDGVITIGDYAFGSCLNLENATLPDGVTTIGHHAFYLCYDLTNAAIPDSVMTIGDGAFSECRCITEVTIPGSVTTIGERAFDSCSELTRVTLQDGITNIGGFAFCGCTSLKSITIPRSVRSIGEAPFIDCNSMTGICVAQDNPNYSSDDAGVLFNKDKTVLIQAPGAITAYTIPNGATDIGYGAFFRCRGLTSINIPESVVTVGRGAFQFCYSLADVYYCGTQEQWSQIDMTTVNDYLTDASIHYGHNFIEKSCSICGEREKFSLADDVWSFTNSPDYYGALSEGYFITDADLRRLLGGLPRTVAESILKSEAEVKLAGKPTTVEQSTFNIDNNYSDIQCLDWGGSCYGMSTWVCLNSYGARKASDIDRSTRTLNGYRLTPAVESAINYYHSQQRLDRVTLACEEYKRLSQVEQLKILQNLGQRANETGEVFLICYGGYSRFNPDGTCDTTSGGGHAVVGYGWEEIEPTKLSILDTAYTYTYRILVYDCNDPEQTYGDWNIYYNDAGIWCIPGRSGREKVSADSVAADDRHDNANLDLVTADISVLNGVDFVTGESEYKSKGNITTIETAHNSSYTLTWDDNVAEISGFTVSSEVENHGLTVLLDWNTTTAGGTVPGKARVILPESDEYTVESVNDAMSFCFQNDNYYMSCVADASGNISFAQDGTVSFLLDEPGDYYLNLVANEGGYSLPWYQVEIQGENAEQISTENTDDGIIVNSDNLESVLITVTNDEGTTEIFGHTDNDAILITQDDGKPVIYEDEDGDGHYEKDITKEENTGCVDSATDTDHLCDECGKKLSECADTDEDHECDICQKVLTECVDENNDRKCDICGVKLENPAEPTNPSEPEESEPTEPSEPKPEVPECEKDETCVLSQFSDIKVDDWYHDGVHFCIDQGLMNGMGEGKFAPNEATTRAQLVIMLYRQAGTPSIEDMTEPFSDVNEGEWYYDAVVWAYNNNVVNGMTATTFEPNTNISREQVATILHRYLGTPAGTGDLSGYPDVDMVQSYAKDALVWAVGEGLINGVAQADGTSLLDPAGNATRAQIATILMRHLTA